jgi:hypothetical protein
MAHDPASLVDVIRNTPPAEQVTQVSDAIRRCGVDLQRNHEAQKQSKGPESPGVHNVRCLSHGHSSEFIHSLYTDTAPEICQRRVKKFFALALAFIILGSEPTAA